MATKFLAGASLETDQNEKESSFSISQNYTCIAL